MEAGSNFGFCYLLYFIWNEFAHHIPTFPELIIVSQEVWNSASAFIVPEKKIKPLVKPIFTMQPINVDVCEGGSSSFSVNTSSASEVSYQWQRFENLEAWNNINDNEILFDDINKKSIKIKKENHKKIISINTNKSIAFVDGGNLEIIKTPALSLFFNRIYYCIYKKNKRVDKKRIEFYSLITSDEKNISSTCYPKIIKDYSFDPFDKDLITSHRRLSVSKVGNFIRRLAELKTSLEINSDFVVLDGSLDYVHKYEKEIINDFNNIAGLSKTISLITKNENKS